MAKSSRVINADPKWLLMRRNAALSSAQRKSMNRKARFKVIGCATLVYRLYIQYIPGNMQMASV